MGYLKGRLHSIRYALQGVRWLVVTQPNTWIHALASLLVILAGWHFQVTMLEWALLALAIGGVWTAEALNTAVEWAVDLCSPGYHPLAGKAKDVAAGAVLLASLTAIAVGLLVFCPRLMS